MRIQACLPLLVLLLIPAVALGALGANTAPVPVAGMVMGPGTGPGGSPVEGARVLLIPTPSLAEAARLEMEGKPDPDPAATATTGACSCWAKNSSGSYQMPRSDLPAATSFTGSDTSEG